MKAGTKRPKTKAVGNKVTKKPKGGKSTGCMIPVGKLNGKTVYQRKAKPKTQGKK